MIQVCKYDARCDKGVVRPGLAPDIDKMVTTGVVDPTSVSSPVYNRIENVEDIGVRVDDVFRSMDVEMSLNRLASDHKNESSKSVKTENA